MASGGAGGGAAPSGGGASSSSSGSGSRSGAEVLRAATLRLMSDLKSLEADCPPGISARPISDSDLFTWVASIVGPDESPFEGSSFVLEGRPLTGRTHRASGGCGIAAAPSHLEG